MKRSSYTDTRERMPSATSEEILRVCDAIAAVAGSQVYPDTPLYGYGEMFSIDQDAVEEYDLEDLGTVEDFTNMFIDNTGGRLPLRFEESFDDGVFIIVMD